MRFKEHAMTCFDMDGLLIDSEPFWRSVQVEVFARHGLQLIETDCIATTGLHIDEVCRYWYARHPWPGATPEQVSAEIVDGMIEAISTRGEPMKGALQAVKAAYSTKKPIALVTSSPARLAWATLDRMGLRDAFDRVESGDNLQLGKPHPELYLRATSALHCPADHALTFEDSLNGILAAKSGRLMCVAVPSEEDRHNPKFAIADLQIHDLTEIDEAWFAALTA